MAFGYHLYPYPDGLRLPGGDTGRLFPEGGWLRGFHQAGYLSEAGVVQDGNSPEAT